MFGWLFGKKKEKKIPKRKYLSKDFTKRRKDARGKEMVYHEPTNDWLYWYMISEYVYNDNAELMTEVPDVLVDEKIYITEPSHSFSDVITTSNYSNEDTSSTYSPSSDYSSSYSDSSSSSSSYDSSNSDW